MWMGEGVTDCRHCVHEVLVLVEMHVAGRYAAIVAIDVLQFQGCFRGFQRLWIGVGVDRGCEDRRHLLCEVDAEARFLVSRVAGQ